jgi:hypothetical protein
MDNKTKPNEVYTFVTNMSTLNEDNHNSCEEYNEYQNLKKQKVVKELNSIYQIQKLLKQETTLKTWSLMT